MPHVRGAVQRYARRTRAMLRGYGPTLLAGEGPDPLQKPRPLTLSLDVLVPTSPTSFAPEITLTAIEPPSRPATLDQGTQVGNEGNNTVRFEDVVQTLEFIPGAPGLDLGATDRSDPQHGDRESESEDGGMPCEAIEFWRQRGYHAEKKKDGQIHIVPVTSVSPAADAGPATVDTTGNSLDAVGLERGVSEAEQITLTALTVDKGTQVEIEDDSPTPGQLAILRRMLPDMVAQWKETQSGKDVGVQVRPQELADGTAAIPKRSARKGKKVNLEQEEVTAIEKLLPHFSSMEIERMSRLFAKHDNIELRLKSFDGGGEGRRNRTALYHIMHEHKHRVPGTKNQSEFTEYRMMVITEIIDEIGLKGGRLVHVGSWMDRYKRSVVPHILTTKSSASSSHR